MHRHELGQTLTIGKPTLPNVPKIEEVHRLVEVMRSIGVTAEWRGRDLILTPPAKISLETFDQVEAARHCSILMLIDPLLYHF